MKISSALMLSVLAYSSNNVNAFGTNGGCSCLPGKNCSIVTVNGQKFA